MQLFPEGGREVCDHGRRRRYGAIVGRAAGHELRRFTGHHSGILSAVFSADGKYVLTASEDGTPGSRMSTITISLIFYAACRPAT